MASASSKLIESHRENAEIHSGLGVAKKKAQELFVKFSLPNGIIYLDNVVEVGFNASTGFFWLKREKKTEHVNPKMGNKGSFEAEITGFIEERKIKKLSGLKVKELLIWIPITEIYITDPASGKITFNTSAGITRSLPVEKFTEDDA